MDKAEPEDQVICWDKQECGVNTDMDCDVYLLMLAYLKFQSKTKRSLQQILRILQLNLFEKWLLSDLITGKHRRNNPANDLQMCMF